ncbi:MAG: ribonuclease HII, partial [Pseudomonadota bacterium]
MAETSYDYEQSLTPSSVIVGVDEVGRGPLAGPVVAAAAMIDRADPIEGLRDSKALSEKRREALTLVIQARALVALGAVSAAEIDRLGIAPATDLAMRRAVLALAPPPGAAIIVDGNRVPDLGAQTTIAEVKADGSCPSVAAASIVAKVTRDRAMVRLSERFPDYHWHTNKGY